MINQVTINNVFSAIQIVDIISPHVKLKKSGSNWKGKCPFHNETDSSFTVSPQMNIYTCFGCNKSGNAVNFLMDHKNLSYPQAIKELASHYSIEVIEDSESVEEDNTRHKRELFLEVYNHAKNFYHDNLFKNENQIALEYALSRFSLDQINQFYIGFASDKWTDLKDYLMKHTPADEALLLETKLISESKGRHFDFFRNRLMFPICNQSNRVISFGGRILPEAKGPKYLNTANSLIYNKSKALFLYNHAAKEIRETTSFYLVEGYTDAITLHGNGITNAVAPCGTALTDDQIHLLKKNARSCTLVYDGDSAGTNAANENTLKLINAGIIVNIVNLPKGQDPDDYFNNPDPKRPTLKKLAQDFLIYKAKKFVEDLDSPIAIHDGIKYLSKLIFSYSDKDLRTHYIDELSKILKVTKKRFVDELASLDASAIASSSELDGLPDNVNVSFYDKYGFYAYNNEYYFRNDKGGKQKLSNFMMKPLFHVESINETKRIYEIINFRGHKIVADFDMQEMVSITNFKKNIEGKGNFLFWGQDQHMNKLKLQLYDDTRTCTEVANLGWQKEGFYAWSNGISDTDGTFSDIDENGLVKFNNKDFFIPAYSKIYIDDRSLFIDERKFRFQKRDFSQEDWSTQFIKVFGDNAKLGIAFWIATLFRDHLLHIFNNFPILNLFGPKGTGKSQMAMSLSCLFGEQQTPFNIHNGTKPGLAEHVQQFVNAFAWIDEYKNNIEYDKIETLKSIYDAIGRNRLNMDKGKKKETTLVNSAVILSGQEMPTADVALFSRVLFLQFHQTEYSQIEKDNYKTLKQIEKEGLSHLSAEIISHRKHFEKNFYSTYDTILADVFKEMEHAGVEDRILASFCMILAAFKTLENKLSLNLTYDDLRKVVIQAISDQNSQISKSNEISMFWETVEALFDEDEIIDRWHFKVDMCTDIKERENTIQLDPAINVLKLKFATIYKAYATHSRKSGQNVLPNSTLKYYLENSPAFLGIEKSSRFKLKNFSSDDGKITEKHQITMAYCFNYKKLGINLIRINTEQDSLAEISKVASASVQATDDPPF